MPPALFTMLQAPFTKLAHTIFPTAIANGIISGAFAFCESPRFLFKTRLFIILNRRSIRHDTLCVRSCELHVYSISVY